MKILDSRHRDILDFLTDNQEYTVTLMDIGHSVGLDHPQKVLDKLMQLERQGYIAKNPFGGYQVLRKYDETNQLALPFFGFAQCGNAGKAILEEYPRKKLIVESGIITPSEQHSCFITRAKGDSMEPFIHSGDFALIQVQSVFSPEDKVLVVHNSKPKIKKIRAEGERWVLHSLNTEHSDIVVEEFDSTNIVGVVRKVFPATAFDV
jgi:SOS-response transcriptional repressor LexA